MILENNLYKVINDANEIFQIDFIRNLNFSFIDCINANKQAKYEQPENYIYKINTIYGKENEEIYFYYIDSDIYIFSGIENIDNNISCKLLKFFSKDFFICIYSQKNITKLSILYYTNEKQIIILHTYEVFNNIFFQEINDDLFLYDTDSINIKIICVRKNDNNSDNIKRILVNIIFHSKNTGIIYISQEYMDDENVNFEINFYGISEIVTTFSFNLNNCNYAMFKSEYLFCCGKNGEINCERRDINLQLINIFDLILSENIKNLTIENHNNTFIELLYYEEKSESKNIYEYYIYPPECNNINKISNINN